MKIILSAQTIWRLLMDVNGCMSSEIIFKNYG